MPGMAANLQTFLEELRIKDNDRVKYTSDAVAICNELMSDLQKMDSDFQSAFDGLSLTGSYLDRVKLVTPDEFDMQIKLKFPFPVNPVADAGFVFLAAPGVNNHPFPVNSVADSQRAGFVFLAAPGGNNHPAVERGYVSRVAIQTWLRNAFQKLFKSYTRLNINGEVYDLKYELQGYGCAHTIVATNCNREISFDFVPVFEYNYSKWPLPAPPVSQGIRDYWPWFAVPQGKKPASDFTFMVCSPFWEREMMKDKHNLKNTLRLMKALRDANESGMPHLSSYMLKTVILLELENSNDNFWQQDLASLLIKMWSKLCGYLQLGNLPFFLDHRCNHFDRLKEWELEKCRRTAEEILRKLNMLNNRCLGYHEFKSFLNIN